MLWKRKEAAARLWLQREPSKNKRVVIEQPKKQISTVTTKLVEKIDALTTSLEQAVKKVGELKKEREGASHKLSKLRDRMGRAEYELDGLQTKL